MSPIANPKPTRSVVFVRRGPGDPDLLTLWAVPLSAEADVVIDPCCLERQGVSAKPHEGLERLDALAELHPVA